MAWAPPGFVAAPYNLGGTLYEPLTGHPAYTGPDGEAGYGGPQYLSLSWTMPDGRTAWYYPGENIQPTNQVALGLLKVLPGVAPLTFDYLVAQIEAANATPAQAQTAAAIALAETGGHWSWHDWPDLFHDRIGLFAIELDSHPEYSFENIYNIQANIDAAAAISNQWRDFTPWGSYTDGSYKAYLPQAPSAPPPPTAPPPPGIPVAGSIESLVDSVVDDVLGGVSVFGWHPANDIKAFLHPLFHAVDLAFGTLYSALRDALTWVEQRYADAVKYAEGILNEAELWAGNAITFATGVVDAAWREGVAVVDAAWRFALGIEHGLWSAAVGAVDAAWRFAVGVVEGAWPDAVSVVDAAWRAGVAVVDASWRFALGVVDGAWQAAVAVVDAAWRAAVDAEHALWSAAVDAVDTAWRDGVAVVDGAWRAFVTDVFDPLEAEAAYWFGTVLAGVEAVIPDVVKAARWIAWIATVSWDDITAWGTQIADLGGDGPGQIAADLGVVLNDSLAVG